MKKALSMALCLLLLLGLIPAGAEEFTLHNGVTFGMNAIQVVTAEGRRNFTLHGDYSLSTPDLARYYDDAHQPALWGIGMIAGIEDSEIGYWFDENSQLFRMQYSLNRWSDKIYTLPILSALEKKYGPPAYSSENGTAISSVVNGYPLTWTDFTIDTRWQEYAEWAGQDITVSLNMNNETDYTWVIPDQDNEYLIIVNYATFNGRINYGGDGGNGDAYFVTYTRVPAADFNNSFYDWTQDL